MHAKKTKVGLSPTLDWIELDFGLYFWAYVLAWTFFFPNSVDAKRLA